MKKFDNIETTLISKWYGNVIEELVSTNKTLNESEIVSLVSETVENRIKEELRFTTEGFTSEIIHNSFDNVDYSELVKYYED